jgi:sortase A
MQVRVLLEPPARPVRKVHAGVSALRWLFLVVGMVALGWSGYVYADAHLYQYYEDWSFDQESKGRIASVIGFLRDAVTPAHEVSPETSASLPAPADDDVKDRQVAPQAADAPRLPADPSMLGRIAIPRLEVHAMVREGVDDRTLRRSVGHVPGTARPGDDGNVGLAGHRDSFFRRLKDVRKQDRIVVETLDSKYEYLVDSIKIVGPEDVQVLAPTPERALTLVTCYPFYYVGNAPRRFIVRARQVSVEARDNAGRQAKSGS